MNRLDSYFVELSLNGATIRQFIAVPNRWDLTMIEDKILEYFDKQCNKFFDVKILRIEKESRDILVLGEN